MFISLQAIACRQDLALNAEQRYPFGAIDAKVSSVRLASGQVDITTADKSKKQQQQTKKKKDPIVLLKMGPTTSNHQPPFCWSQVRFHRLINFVPILITCTYSSKERRTTEA